MKSLLIAALVLGSTSMAFANHEKEGPCKEVKSACEAAGFTKGGHKNHKGLIKDCMQPIMEGKSVEGVTVGADVVASCKEKKVKHAQKQGEKAAAEAPKQ